VHTIYNTHHQQVTEAGQQSHKVTFVAAPDLSSQTFTYFIIYLFICSQNVTYKINVLPCTKRAGQQGTDNRH